MLMLLCLVTPPGAAPARRVRGSDGAWRGHLAGDRGPAHTSHHGTSHQPPAH